MKKPLSKGAKIAIASSVAGVVVLGVFCCVFSDQLFDLFGRIQYRLSNLNNPAPEQDVFPLHKGFYETSDKNGNAFTLRLTPSTYDEWKNNHSNVAKDDCLLTFRESDYIRFDFKINGETMDLPRIGHADIPHGENYTPYTSEGWEFFPIYQSWDQERYYIILNTSETNETYHFDQPLVMVRTSD